MFNGMAHSGTFDSTTGTEIVTNVAIMASYSGFTWNYYRYQSNAADTWIWYVATVGQYLQVFSLSISSLTDMTGTLTTYQVPFYVNQITLTNGTQQLTVLTYICGFARQYVPDDVTFGHYKAQTEITPGTQYNPYGRISTTVNQLIGPGKAFEDDLTLNVAITAIQTSSLDFTLVVVREPNYTV